jgi:aminoglycoside phosphotransferase (APT) family kinase protein
MSAADRFTEEAMTAAMRQIAEEIGVPAADARLLQLTNNAVFALPTAGLVIRIARSHTLHDRVPKAVQLAGWLAEVDAPTIRLAPTLGQPVQLGDLLASIWRYLPPEPPAPTADDLGDVLREFHALDAPPFPLPAWDPIGDVRLRLTDAESLSENDREFLTEWCDWLDPQVADLRDRASGQLIHGDAHVSNLLRGPDGRAVLCDLDATCLGPWQVDLVAVAVGEARFGGSGSHSKLRAAYGYDVTTDPDWSILREARELKMIAAATPLLASSPAIAAEFNSRVRSIQKADSSALWVPFARLNR